MRAPKFNRCDYCGRSAHKVAIKFADGHVDGMCPGCFNGRTVKVLPPEGVTPRPYYDVPFTAWLGGEGATILYDRRGRKPGVEYPVVRQETYSEKQARLTRLDGSRFAWKACGHPAERDIEGACYTCHEEVE